MHKYARPTLLQIPIQQRYIPIPSPEVPHRHRRLPTSLNHETHKRKERITDPTYEFLGQFENWIETVVLDCLGEGEELAGVGV